jgi:FlaA1/EpsC-like NDP-sugar epimerase
MMTPSSTSATPAQLSAIASPTEFRKAPWLTHSQLLVLDVTLLTAVWGLAWTLRFEGLEWLTSSWREAASYHLLLAVPMWIGIMAAFRLYRRAWSMASIEEVKTMMAAVFVATIANVTLGVFLLPVLGLSPTRLPLSVISSHTMWSIVALTLPRLLARVWIVHRRQRRDQTAQVPVLILGAGASGRLTAREMLEHPAMGLHPIGYLDDDASKCHLHVGGLRVLGPVSELEARIRAHGVRHVIVTMSSAPGAKIREIVRICTAAGVETRTMPQIGEILSGRIGVNQLRPVEIQDLLRRAPVQTDLGSVRRIVEGQTVLVTGAGGSIGSELCRQIARNAPAHLLLLGHGENSIFEIQQELRSHFPAVPLTCLIADIRDETRLDAIFSQYRPNTVFHAAAHKHVPLMEENLAEAITNNVKGTRTLIDAAVRHDTPQFVLISSDKAVNPSSIMGATKRIAELLVQRAAVSTGRNYVSVRFGNVLGSRGSVVPTFLRQIRAGGPITITHPDMQRYFMTIPEAVQLVLQAAVLGQGGEVFVLDMGEPIKIVDLASDLIRLSGLRVGDDVEIHFTGLRPGEKLFEELSRDDESLLPTSHHTILCSRLGIPPAGVHANVDALVQSAMRRDDDTVLRQRIAELVPEYIALGTTHPVPRELTLVA